jgi:hypothetical protein
MAMGLSVSAALGLAGCHDRTADGAGIDADDLLSENGLSMNGLSMNGLSMNGLSMNGLSMNGLSMNGLSMNGIGTVGGLSSTSGLMTTAGGRDIVKYLVRCALPMGQSFTKQDQSGTSYTFPGAIGIAPEAVTGTCDLDCQEKVSACMLAHVNNSGAHIGIWLVGPDAAIGWGSNSSYPYQEGAFFGNLFPSNWQGYYCAGKDMSSGEVPGRLGTPLATNVYTNPYGGGVSCSGNCAVTNEGYTQCNDSWPKAPYVGQHKWNHVVTVWRNFETTQAYKICTKAAPVRCLGVVGGSVADGASIEQRTFNGATSQQWQILQVEAGKYKFVNVASGKAMDVNGSQMVQRAYTGAAAQKIPVVYFNDQPGFANLKPSAGSSGLSADSTNEGSLVKLTTNLSPDYAKWNFTALGTVASGGTTTPPPPATPPPSTSLFSASRTYHLIPQSASNKSLDVCGGSQNVGSCIQQYSTDFNNGNQAFYLLPSGSNWKIAMKANTNKCLGTLNNATANGTAIVIQDCNGSAYQSFTVDQDGGAGIYRFKLAANPSECLDMAGGATADGTKAQIYSCWSPASQKFSVQ